MKKERGQAEQKKDLALFVKKMQLAGVNIVTIKKPTDARTSISREDLHTIYISV